MLSWLPSISSWFPSKPDTNDETLCSVLSLLGVEVHLLDNRKTMTYTAKAYSDSLGDYVLTTETKQLGTSGVALPLDETEEERKTTTSMSIHHFRTGFVVTHRGTTTTGQSTNLHHFATWLTEMTHGKAIVTVPTATTIVIAVNDYLDVRLPPMTAIRHNPKWILSYGTHAFTIDYIENDPSEEKKLEGKLEGKPLALPIVGKPLLLPTAEGKPLSLPILIPTADDKPSPTGSTCTLPVVAHDIPVPTSCPPVTTTSATTIVASVSEVKESSCHSEVTPLVSVAIVKVSGFPPPHTIHITRRRRCWADDEPIVIPSTFHQGFKKWHHHIQAGL
jgi:hypothetical protein